MDKGQAIQAFWSSFGLPAYEQTDVPDDAEMPYITYDVSTAALDEPISLTASLWYRSTRWAEISQKSEEIARLITTKAKPDALDGGYLWVVKGSPFAQRMSDTDETVRRIVLNIQAEFITAY